MTRKKRKAFATVLLSENEALGEKGGSLLLPGTLHGNILVVNLGKGSYAALSNVCPHKRCEVTVRKKQYIQCPCHRSAYKLDRAYVSGPARRGLTRYPVTVEDGIVYIFEAGE